MCLKFWFLIKWEKPVCPPKKLRGPLEGRGPPVEKHCLRRSSKSIDQGWPKCGPRAACGPPKNFCDPCVNFGMHNSAIYDAIMYENTQNLYINLHIYGRKNKAKIFCGPQYNISMKFGPPEKKSGHPWYRPIWMHSEALVTHY